MSRGEKQKNPDVCERYLIESDRKYRLEQKKKAESISNNIDASTEKLKKPIKVNGVVYPSVIDAALSMGVCVKTLRLKIKKLEKSQRSTMDFEIRITKTFTLEKVK